MSGSHLNGCLDPAFNPFADNYLAEMLAAVVSAWSQMKMPHNLEIEDKITRRLCGRLLNDPHFEDLPYDVSCQHSLLGIDGEYLGRLDLRFKHRHSHRDYFALEAKRLHVTYPSGKVSPEYTTYAGEEGMMAFVEGQYSVGLSAGGMLGYVMDGDSGKAWNGLVKCIGERTNPLKLAPNSGLVKSAILLPVTANLLDVELGETEHSAAVHQFRLMHLLLPVFSAEKIN